MSPRSEKNKAPKLEDFCSITSSKRIYAADYVEDGIPFVRGKEVVQRFFGSGPLESELFISPTKFETLRDRFGAPTAGDLLLTSVGTLGVPYLVTDSDEFYFKDGNLIWFRSFDGLNSKFFYYWIRSRAGRAQLAKCTIGTSQAAYTIERLKEVEAPKHSIAQQERIADFLSAYDDLIENNRRRIALLEEAARLLYREWFVHFRFPGHEHVNIIDGLPVGWKRVKMEQVLIALESGGRPRGGASESDGIPSIGAENVIALGQYDYSKEKYVPEDYFAKMRRGVIQSRDVLLYKDGANIGRSSMFGDSFPHSQCAVNEHVFILRTGAKVGQSYLYFWLSQPETRQSVVNLNANTAQPGISQAKLKSLWFTLPPEPLRNLFNESVEAQVAQIFRLALMNQKLAQARDLLLPRLMNGEIAV